MILAGFIIFIIALGLLILGGTSDNEAGGRVLCALGGFALVLAFNFLLPPFKDRKNEDFQVKTNNKVEINKEVFIDKNNKADTTYYYIFKDSDVMPIE